MFKYSVFEKPILLQRFLNCISTKLLVTKCPGPDGSQTEILSKDAKLEILEKKFAIFQNTDSKSLLKKYLTKNLFNKLKTKQTIFQSTLLDCIQSGFANPDSNIGVYAPDPDAYTTFRDLFDLIIEDYHNGFTSTSMHPAKDFGNMSCFEDVDPECDYVVSCRIRCGRSIEGYPFNPCLKRYHYSEIEQTLKTILKSLQREFKGDYHDLCSMDTQLKQKLIEDHYLFKEGDRFLQAANACRFWPLGRGIFLNKPKTFVVWVNEEDHIRIISMQKGGDVKAVYSRLVKGINGLATRLNFSKHERLGYLTFCPTNLGTTIRASVHIKLPKLSKDKAKFEEVASRFHLQIRGTSGEHSESIGGVYDISNKQRIGITEYEAVKMMQDGILEMIKIEKTL